MSQSLYGENLANPERAGQIGTVRAGTKYYEGFLTDNILTFKKDLEELLAAYNIDPGLVYISGCSGGGETLSLALSERPELYTAALHVSSGWDGDLSRVAEGRTPVYFAIGEGDEYYGSGPAKEAYGELVALYEQTGVDREEIDRLTVLDSISWLAERDSV